MLETKFIWKKRLASGEILCCAWLKKKIGIQVDVRYKITFCSIQEISIATYFNLLLPADKTCQVWRNLPLRIIYISTQMFLWETRSGARVAKKTTLIQSLLNKIWTNSNISRDYLDRICWLWDINYYVKLNSLTSRIEMRQLQLWKKKTNQLQQSILPYNNTPTSRPYRLMKTNRMRFTNTAPISFCARLFKRNVWISFSRRTWLVFFAKEVLHGICVFLGWHLVTATSEGR